MDKIKVLELFAGTKSIGKAAKELGYEVFSSDYLSKFDTDYTVDLLEFDVSRVPWKPDIIWASPPCPTHSRMNLANGLNPYKDNTRQKQNGGGIAVRYPDMKLYEEIILLKTWHRGLWCVENVVGYYEPLIAPIHFGSHYFWTNFHFPTHGVTTINRGIGGANEPRLEELAKMKGFNLEDLKGFGIDLRLALRDITESELAEHIFHYVLNPYEANQKLFA
jgi:hypothetical protein